MTQLNCPLANEDTDEHYDQPPQQAHTLRYQLRGEADKRKPDIIINFSLENMTMSISTWQRVWLPWRAACCQTKLTKWWQTLSSSGFELFHHSENCNIGPLHTKNFLIPTLYLSIHNLKWKYVSMLPMTKSMRKYTRNILLKNVRVSILSSFTAMTRDRHAPPWQATWPTVRSCILPLLNTHSCVIL